VLFMRLPVPHPPSLRSCPQLDRERHGSAARVIA